MSASADVQRPVHVGAWSHVPYWHLHKGTGVPARCQPSLLPTQLSLLATNLASKQVVVPLTAVHEPPPKQPNTQGKKRPRCDCQLHTCRAPSSSVSGTCAHCSSVDPVVSTKQARQDDCVRVAVRDVSSITAAQSSTIDITTAPLPTQSSCLSSGTSCPTTEAALPTALVYDAGSHVHKHPTHQHPERPERISTLLTRLRAEGLLNRCCTVESPLVTDEALLAVHHKFYIRRLAKLPTMTTEQLVDTAGEYESVYLNQDTLSCAKRAAGGLVSLVEAVVVGQARNGLALIRPPGHHAESHAAKGFCVINNVAVAARHARNRLGVKRVLIVDWDCHHGQGTQRVFLQDPSVMYFSLHRYDHGTFYPSTAEASHKVVGTGAGAGYNINVAWNGPGMGDAEYLAAFQRLLLPVARDFNPDLVLVSAGFDAAEGDPLGGCRVTPSCFATMTHALMGLAGGRVVLALEGGYKLSVLADCVAACGRALLGEAEDDLLELEADTIFEVEAGAAKSIDDTISAHQPFWLCLNSPPPLSSAPAEVLSLHICG